MIQINNEFDLGQIVYLRTDPEQLPHIVIGISKFADGGVNYVISFRNEETRHYACEMSNEIDTVLKTSY